MQPKPDLSIMFQLPIYKTYREEENYEKLKLAKSGMCKSL